MSDDLIGALRGLTARSCQLSAGEYLFRRDDPVASIFLVESGEVHLVRFQYEGSALVLQRVGAGQVAAEASLYSRTYHCDAVALRSSVVLEIPGAAFRQAMGSKPAFAESWSRHLAREVQKSRSRSELLTIKTVAGRVDAWLNLNGGSLPGKGELKVLASEIGVSPEALYREMANRRKT